MNKIRLVELLARWKTFTLGLVKGMVLLSAWVMGGAIAVFAIRYPFYNDEPVTYVSWALWIVGFTFCLMVVVMLGFWLFSFRPALYTVGALVVVLMLTQCFHREHGTDCIETRYVSCP